jgi:hypothetical protein
MSQGSRLSLRMGKPELAEDIEAALQETNRNRRLDSLETTIVQTVLVAHGIHIKSGFSPRKNTILGWLEWVDRSSKAR